MGQGRACQVGGVMTRRILNLHAAACIAAQAEGVAARSDMALLASVLAVEAGQDAPDTLDSEGTALLLARNPIVETPELLAELAEVAP